MPVQNALLPTNCLDNFFFRESVLFTILLTFQISKEITVLRAEKDDLTKSVNLLQEKLDSSGLEKAKLDNLIRDLKEELKVNFLAKQELKLQLETAAERENTVKSELKKKEKELKTEVEKNKVSKIYL